MKKDRVNPLSNLKIPTYAKKLTTVQQDAVLSAHDRGDSIKDIAIRFGIHKDTVQNLVDVGFPWIELTEPKRCSECGTKINTEYCVSCRMTTGNLVS